MNFARVAIAVALADGNPGRHVEIAERRWGEKSSVAMLMKSAGSTTGATWGSELVSSDRGAETFFEVIAERSVLGRLGLRRVPPRVRAITPVAGSTAAWHEEGRARPISELALTATELPLCDLGVVIVATRDLLESNDPLAEASIREDMLAAAVSAIDGDLLDPENAGIPGIKPAALNFIGTDGIPLIPSTGVFKTDLETLVGEFAGDLAAAQIVLHPADAVAICSAEFPNVGARGGELAGLPVLTSRNAPRRILTLVDPNGVALVEEEAEQSTSRVGAIEVSTSPSGDSTAPTATQVVSLFQTNSLALAFHRRLNWAVMRDSAVAALDLSEVTE